MDTLVEASTADLQEYLQRFYNLGVKGAPPVCTIQTKLEIEENGHQSYFKFYKPYGNINNGLVAVNSIPKVPVNITIYALDKNHTNIEEALVNTKLINWAQIVWIAAISVELRATLHRVARRLKIDIGIEARFVGTILPKDTEPFKVQCPSDLYVGKLNPEHAKLVNSTWIYLDHPSEDYFRYLITTGKALAFYRKVDNKPVCWQIVNEYGNPDFLYTIQEYRDKGLAQIMCKFTYNEMLSEQKDIIGYAELKDNFKPLHVQLNLSSEIFGLFYYMEFIPQNQARSKL